VAQRKKAAVRAAILEAAFILFSDKGYTGATVPQIAAKAGVSSANVYVYFRSKLEILFAIYEPWLRQRMEDLDHELARTRSPAQRLRRLVTALWRDIPAANNGFTTNIMQAISAGSREQGYESNLIKWLERRIAEMIRKTLADAGAPPTDPEQMAHILFMAFDGFSINFHLNPWAAVSDEAIETFCAMMLRGAGGPGPRARPARRKPSPGRAGGKSGR
jgi:AcrR family transcriptional regulator